MINQRIENAVKFIRQARDDADCLYEHILFFGAFLLMATGTVFIAFALCMLVFTIPRVFIPLYLTIFILWQGYKRL